MLTYSLDLFLGVECMPGTTDTIYISRQIQEKYIGKNSNLYGAFVDLEKVFDRVPRKVGPVAGFNESRHTRVDCMCGSDNVWLKMRKVI